MDIPGGGNFPCPNIKLEREVVLRGIMDIGMSPIDKYDPRLADIIIPVSDYRHYRFVPIARINPIAYAPCNFLITNYRNELTFVMRRYKYKLDR